MTFPVRPYLRQVPREVLGYMQQTNGADLIPAALDPGITVHHMYGVVQEGYVHDAAILSSGGRSYAVAIYIWGPDDADSPDRLRIIHRLTRKITAVLLPLTGNPVQPPLDHPRWGTLDNI